MYVGKKNFSLYRSFSRVLNKYFVKVTFYTEIIIIIFLNGEADFVCGKFYTQPKNHFQKRITINVYLSIIRKVNRIKICAVHT